MSLRMYVLSTAASSMVLISSAGVAVAGSSAGSSACFTAANVASLNAKKQSALQTYRSHDLAGAIVQFQSVAAEAHARLDQHRNAANGVRLTAT